MCHVFTVSLAVLVCYLNFHTPRVTVVRKKPIREYRTRSAYADRHFFAATLAWDSLNRLAYYRDKYVLSLVSTFADRVNSFKSHLNILLML
jgi:hypothetical protein